MQTKINKVEVLQFVQDNDEFLITYYAKKHNEIITRRGTWRKPIEPNKNGNKWRHATNPSVERINNDS